MDDENVYAPPKSELEQADNDQPLASRWFRLWGAMIDAIIGIAIAFPAMFFSGYWERAMNQQITVTDTIAVSVFGFMMFVAVHGYFLARDGQTIGKKLVGTRIVSADSNQILPLWKVVLLRYLPITISGQIPLVGGVLVTIDYLFVFRRDKRCIHDLIATTRVVKADAS